MLECHAVTAHSCFVCIVGLHPQGKDPFEEVIIIKFVICPEKPRDGKFYSVLVTLGCVLFTAREFFTVLVCSW